MSVIHSYSTYLKSLLVLIFLALMTGCIAEDKKDEKPTNSEGEPVDNTALSLNGFWNGGFEQKDTLRVLIFNGDVYGLDADKAFFGTVESPSQEEVDFSVIAYPFSYKDAVNFEFVADGIATTYTINGLLVTNTSLVGDFETDMGQFGSLDLVNDETFTKNSSLISLAGKWTTTDLEMNISSRGRFHGVSNGTDNNCSFEGQINLINATDSLLSLTLDRRHCKDFNGSSVGFVAINGDGKLELYSKMKNALLFMTFTAPKVSEGTANPEVPVEGDSTPKEEEKKEGTEKE